MEDKLEELKKKLEECQKKQAEYLAYAQRTKADFLNYKKEETERIIEFLKYGNLDLILKILPVLDNFEKAEKEVPIEEKDNKFLHGFLQIKIQLQDFLKNHGRIEEIKTINKKFDPNFQEAIEVIEKKGVESGTILEEIQKGYLFQGKVIRPAKVKVAK